MKSKGMGTIAIVTALVSGRLSPLVRTEACLLRSSPIP